jgi:nicotinic acid mononucleotide adenylyltransferase
MNSFIRHLEEAKLKPVVFTFGRFNPITKGHQAMIEYVTALGRKKGGQSMIFPSQSHDPKKNPLDFNTKVKYMKKFFPKSNIVKNTKVKTAFDVLKILSDKGFKDVTMVVGGDRVAAV